MIGRDRVGLDGGPPSVRGGRRFGRRPRPRLARHVARRRGELVRGVSAWGRRGIGRLRPGGVDLLRGGAGRSARGGARGGARGRRRLDPGPLLRLRGGSAAARGQPAGGDEDADDAQRGEPGAERGREREPWAREGGEDGADAPRPELGRLLGCQSEVPRPDGGRELGHRGRDRAQVVVEGGARLARRDERGGTLELGTRRIAGGIRRDQLGVVVGVLGVGQVGHQSPSPRNRPIESSSRSRSASRPRWIRDLTVPRETPVRSAISW